MLFAAKFSTFTIFFNAFSQCRIIYHLQRSHDFTSARGTRHHGRLAAEQLRKLLNCEQVHSSAVIAIGFSTSTPIPFSEKKQLASQWRKCGRLITTTSSAHSSAIFRLSLRRQSQSYTYILPPLLRLHLKAQPQFCVLLRHRTREQSCRPVFFRQHKALSRPCSFRSGS